MALTIKFEHPHFPEDTEFSFNDLGVVKNGGTLTVDEDAERAFIATRGMTVEDAFKTNTGASVGGVSSLSTDEKNQLVAQANPVPVKKNEAQPVHVEPDEDPNEMILGGENQ
jgi:hypothetical protein